MKTIDTLKAHVSRIEKHAAALSIKPESCSTDLTLDEIKEIIGLIERQHSNTLSCFGSYIDASQIAQDAIRAISNALTEGMHHSRPALEQDFTSLKLRLHVCQFGKDKPNPLNIRPAPIEGGTIFMLAPSNEHPHIAPEGSHVWQGTRWEGYPAGQQFQQGVWYSTPDDTPCPIPLKPL